MHMYICIYEESVGFFFILQGKSETSEISEWFLRENSSISDTRRPEIAFLVLVCSCVCVLILQTTLTFIL